MNFFTAVNATPAPVAVTAGIVQDGLWLDWRPEYTSGTTVLDQSGKGHNGTLYNGASVTTTPSGEQAFYFDGINDYLRYQFNSRVDKPSNDYPITYEFWAYSLNNQVSYAILNEPSAVVDWERLYISRNNGINAIIHQKYTRSGGRYVNTRIDNATTDNQWYHLAFTVRKDFGIGQNVIDSYVNGVLTQTVTSTYGTSYWDVIWSNNPTVVNVVMGSIQRSSPLYYNGYGGDYRIYGRQLSTAEIQQNFDATKSKYGY